MTTTREPRNFDELIDELITQFDDSSVLHSLGLLGASTYEIARPDRSRLVFGPNDGVPGEPDKEPEGFDFTYYAPDDEPYRSDWAPTWAAMVEVIRQSVTAEGVGQ